MYLWGVYSYGISERWDGFEFYFPVFDRRHNVNLVGTYLFGKKKNTELNIRWNLGSGLPYTATGAFYQGETFQGGVTDDYLQNNPGSVSNILGEFNSQRLPFYHRFDLTVKQRFTFKKDRVLEIIGSVTNVYNRRNIFLREQINKRNNLPIPNSTECWN